MTFRPAVRLVPGRVRDVRNARGGRRLFRGARHIIRRGYRAMRRSPRIRRG